MNQPLLFFLEALLREGQTRRKAGAQSLGTSCKRGSRAAEQSGVCLIKGHLLGEGGAVFPSKSYAKQYSINGVYGHLTDKQWPPGQPLPRQYKEEL
jgi:hypothetical protein